MKHLLCSLISALTIGGTILAQPVVTMTPVITGLSGAMQVVHAGDSSKRIFIVQRAGSIRVFDKNYTSLGNFISFTGISTNGEGGLLSLAFHPNYASNGYFFIYYTNSGGDLEVSRYQVTSNPNVAEPATKKIVITIPHPTNSNHNGGELHFGPDGYLYLSTGDGGGGGDQPNNAQNLTRLLGKLLRMDVSTDTTGAMYTIPADNPFGNEIYAYGLRNPFRWSFDRHTNDAWIGDVGQASFEEVNYRQFDSLRGTNFGWRCYEGHNTYNTNGCGARSNYVFPALSYPTPDPSGSITGGTVYRGETYLDFAGYYTGIDFYTGRMYLLTKDSLTNQLDTSSQASSFTGISDFGESEEGELFATGLYNGTLYRVGTTGPARYRFTGNGNWNVPENWAGKLIPPAVLPNGSQIEISPEGNGECILNIQQTISNGASITVANDKQFRILGNLTMQ